MIDIQNTIKNLIQNTLTELELPQVDFVVEHPGELEHGDFSTNIVFALTKNIKTQTGASPFPNFMAQKIIEVINKNLPPEIEKVEIAGPGFINFYLSKEFFGNSIKTISENNDTWGKNETLKGKNILVEHSSPNLFKPFHIGHVMNNTIGESITRLAHFGSGNVTLISYPSDVSLGIGKAVYVLLEKGIETLDTFSTLQEKLTFLGECYVEGTKMYDADVTIQPRVKQITEKIFEKTPSKEYDAYLVGKNINLDYFVQMTKTLGSEFDAFIYESEAGSVGKQIVLENTPRIFTESEGAVIYDAEQDDKSLHLHTRVFINKEGYPTYEAKDTGLLSLKFERYNPDISIFITDHEQTDYFRVVSTAAGKINPIWQERTIHRTHGRMTFKGQKMSSRLGGVPTAKDTLDTLIESVKEVAKNELTETDVEKIAIAALKYTILRTQAGKNINFDPETSLSFEGDSGPYLLYSCIRAKSILQKAEMLGLHAQGNRPHDLNVLPLEKMLYRFPEIVERSLSEYAPHHVAIYLTELASLFNAFYANTPILQKENLHQEYQLAIVQSFVTTMENGLNLLGISVPSKM